MSNHKFNPHARGTLIHKPAFVRDIYGRVLRVGDQVHLQTIVHQPYQVTDIVPVVDPKLPENMTQITLVSSVRFIAKNDQRNNEFVRVVEYEGQPAEVQPTERQPDVEIIRDVPEEDPTDQPPTEGEAS